MGRQALFSRMDSTWGESGRDIIRTSLQPKYSLIDRSSISLLLHAVVLYHKLRT